MLPLNANVQVVFRKKNKCPSEPMWEHSEKISRIIHSERVMTSLTRDGREAEIIQTTLDENQEPWT